MYDGDEDEDDLLNKRYFTCAVCKCRTEVDYSGLATPEPYCSNSCVAKRRAELRGEIAQKHGISLETLESILSDMHRMPPFSQR